MPDELDTTNLVNNKLKDLHQKLKTIQTQAPGSFSNDTSSNFNNSSSCPSVLKIFESKIAQTQDEIKKSKTSFYHLFTNTF